jgi:hypothetical protein
MNQPSWPERLGSQCERYGPGRLPWADRRAAAAGYALATAALLSTVVWTVGVGGVRFLAGWPFSQSIQANALLALGGLTALFFVPGAFVSGAVAWRYLPGRLRRHGIVTDLLAMVGAYVVGTALFAPFAVLFSDATFLFEDPLSVLYVGFVAFLASGWLTLPTGAAIGHVHRRARGGTDGSVPGAGPLHAVRSYLRPALCRTITIWARYGPGRLPGGQRPAVGAGYAFASVAAALSLAVSTVLAGAAVVSSGDVPFDSLAEFLRYGFGAPVGAYAPVAFAAGAVSWRVLPDGLSARGAVAGAGTTAVVALVGGSIYAMLLDIPTTYPVWSVVGVGAYVLLAFGWVLLPLGALVGHVHQRAQ